MRLQKDGKYRANVQRKTILLLKKNIDLAEYI